MLCNPWNDGNWYSNNFRAEFMCISVSSFPVISKVLSASFKVKLKICTHSVLLSASQLILASPSSRIQQSLGCLLSCVRSTTLVIASDCLFSSRVPLGGSSSTSPNLCTTFAVNSVSFQSSLVGLSVVLLNLIILLDNMLNDMVFLVHLEEYLVNTFFVR